MFQKCFGIHNNPLHNSTIPKNLDLGTEDGIWIVLPLSSKSYFIPEQRMPSPNRLKDAKPNEIRSAQPALKNVEGKFFVAFFFFFICTSEEKECGRELAAVA